MNKIRFSRRLKLWQVVARGLGVMLVLSVFVLLNDTAAAAGSLSPLIILLAGLFLLANVLGYIELALSVPGSSIERNRRRIRVGGAYIQIYDIQGGWLSFLTGWTLIAAGLLICALLAKTFAIQITTILTDFLRLEFPAWPWAAILVVLSAANNGLGTRGRRQSQALVLFLAIMLGFILLAIPNIDFDNYTMIQGQWNHVFPLLLVPFIGIELVGSLQGEMAKRVRDTPRALLLTLGLGFVLAAMITAVAVGVVGDKALAGTQVPLAQLGTRLIGGAGRPFILMAGAFGLALAFRGSLTLVTRQIFAMSKDGYLPAVLRHIQPRFGTPIWSILLVTFLTLPLVTVPGHYLSRMAGTLHLFVLMGINLTLLLNKQVESCPFKLPFHPWVPGLVLILDLFLLPLSGALYLALGAAFLAAGSLIYFLSAREHHIETKEGKTVFKPPPEERSELGYRILVPVANPATAGALIRLAGVLARQQNGEVLALQVVTVPDQVPLEEGRRRAEAGRIILEQALNQAKEENFVLQTMTRVAQCCGRYH